MVQRIGRRGITYAVNKPHNVLSHFTATSEQVSLQSLNIPDRTVYAAGRLDKDSVSALASTPHAADRLCQMQEGLLILTNSPAVVQAIRSVSKQYWVQIEGQVDSSHLAHLERGVSIKLRTGNYMTEPSTVLALEPPVLDNFLPPPADSVAGRLWPAPYVRKRRSKATQWISASITEGKNRQVRKMTAAVGLPCLRLVRVAVGPVSLLELGLSPGEFQQLDESLFLHQHS